MPARTGNCTQTLKKFFVKVVYKKTEIRTPANLLTDARVRRHCIHHVLSWIVFIRGRAGTPYFLVISAVLPFGHLRNR